MYNKIVRNSTYLNELKVFIEKNYGLSIIHIEQAKRGFWGETWRIETATFSYFVKIDYAHCHKQIYIDSLSIIEYLNNQGIQHICKIIKTKNQDYHSTFSSGVLCIFNYVEGVNTEDFELSRLFEKLAPIYKLSAEGIQIMKEDFNTSCIDSYYFNLSRLKKSAEDTQSKDLVRFLESKSLLMEHGASRLILFADRCKRDFTDFHITHGDAGGNVIINDDIFTIIDWDSPMFSPIERDAWFFMGDNHNIDMINDTLALHGISYELNNNRLAFYCYYSFFYYLHEYFTCFFESGSNMQDSITQNLHSYFNGWVMRLIEKADKFL